MYAEGSVHPVEVNDGSQIVPIPAAEQSVHRVVGLHVSSNAMTPVRIELQAVHPGTSETFVVMAPRILEPGKGFDLVGALGDLPTGTHLKILVAEPGVLVSGSVHVIAVKGE